MTRNAKDITLINDFENWLKVRPHTNIHEEAIILASRCCLRALFVIFNKINLPDDKLAPQVLAGFHSLVIARAATIKLDNEIIRSAKDIGLWPPFSSAMRALDLCNPLDNIKDLASFVAEAAHASGHSDTLQDLNSDALRLENGMSVEELASSPLFINSDNYGTESKESKFGYARIMGLSFSIWTEWCFAAIKGRPIFGIQNKTLRDDLERNIALGSTDGKFNKAFWDREPATINADIKRWVDEARAADQKLLPSKETSP